MVSSLSGSSGGRRNRLHVPDGGRLDYRLLFDMGDVGGNATVATDETDSDAVMASGFLFTTHGVMF